MVSAVKRIRQSLPEGRAIAEEVWQRRHRAMVALLWMHALAICAYSFLAGNGLAHSLFEGGVIAVCAAGAQWGPEGRRFRSVSATLGLTSASAILVHLSHGMIEFHFHYFVTLAVVSLYHDWAPFLAAIGFVAVQHGAVGALDPHSVYNHADAIAHPWKWATIHASFVLAASAVSLVRWKSSEVEALKDPLTWLPNRALFGDRLRQALVRRESGTRVAVLFLDVDDFKGINDTAGHAAGDKLLIVVADRLREVVRAADTVARLGGDEFAIVLEDVDEPTVTHVARRILETLRAPLTFEGRTFSVTASIGIALRHDEETTEAELLRNADIAMYVAKKNGKGGYAFFEPSMHREVLERAELAKDLMSAVQRGQMNVLYQPVVHVSDGSIAGFEALIRWHHPRLGVFGPMRFIPLAEETGQIVPIGRWVLETACAQAVAWDAQFGADAPRWMSVNVSPRQLVEHEFVDDVAAVLRSTSLEPERLVLEITEGAMVGENEQIIAQLHRLKALGVTIALDDFGTGYSSLGYLRRLPIDILKIDKAFVDGLDLGSEDAALARAILKIAESMGLRCIAEGVEREEQAQQLRIAGCELAQGFLFSKPIEARQVDAMLLWAPKPPERRGTILIVDEDAELRTLVSRKLRDAGFATIEVATPVDALCVLTERTVVDLLIIDVRLNDSHAAELTHRVAGDAANGVPVLYLSGDPSELDEIAQRRGTLIRKPVRDDELVDNVRTLLARPA